MKKLLTLLLISVFVIGYAQNFELTDSRENPYTDGDTISAIITTADLNFRDEYVIEILVKNLTDFALDVKTSRTNIIVANGMLAYVCFGECDDTGNIYDMDYLIEGDHEPYALHLAPNDNIGLNMFKLEFWTKPDKTDKMTLYVEIDVTRIGVMELNHANVSLSAFPNPAPVNSRVSISYTLADKNSGNNLIIRNIMGAEVMSMPLNPGKNSASIDISPLVPGVYFYTIENKSHISIVRKLIVK